MKPGADVDIGKPTYITVFHVLIVVQIGANPSAEEGDEALEDGAVQTNNVVHSFRLQSTTFDKKNYLTYLKVGRIMSDLRVFYLRSIRVT